MTVAPASGPIAVGIDIGGTKLVGGLVDAEGRVLARTRRDTPAGTADELLATLEEVVRELRPGAAPVPVGVAIAALIDRAGVVRYGPNIGVRDLALADRLSDVLRAPVALVNDASAATVGEQRVGVARGLADVAMLTLGTGVGGGLIVAGRLVEGHDGMAGELGHLIVEDGGRPCPCGTRGCLEAYASGRAMEAAARARFAGGDLDVLEPATPLTGRAVVAAAGAGVRAAQEVLEDVGRWVGVAVASIAAAFDPAIVVLGGGAGVATAPWVLPAAREAAAARLFGRGWRRPVRIEPAALGDDAGLVGVALLALDPTDAGVHR